MTNELVAMSPKNDADRLKTEAPIPDQELAYRAAKYFPEEKARVCQQTDKALEGIKSLVKVGAMTPEQGANLGAQMMAMRDKILGAVPNDALYNQKRAVADPLQKTYDTGKSLVNRATDAAFFNVMGMGKLAEKYPKTGETMGKFYLGEAKLAQTGAVVIGTAGLAYFAVTATITTGAAVGTAYVVKNILEYVGVNKEASTAYAAATSFLVAAKVGNSETVQSAESSISEAIMSKAQSAWGVVKNIFGEGGQLVKNESGIIAIPTRTRVPPGEIGTNNAFNNVQFEDLAIREGLKIANPKATMPESEIVNFKEWKAKPVLLEEGETLYRVHSEGRAGGSWWTRTKPVSEIQARIDNAIKPEWNNFNELSEITVPKGYALKSWQGQASYQGGVYVGEGEQFYIERVPKEWINTIRVRQ